MGADSGAFRIRGSGDSGVLRFRSSPNYEAPTDTGSDNTYMVTVKASVGGEMGTQDVTVTVTDVTELGALEGAASVPYAENNTDEVGSYTIRGQNAASATWTLEGADSRFFVLSGSDASRMLRFRSSPNFEMPRGQAISATNTNTYAVTLKAEVGGEINTRDVTVTVTNVSEIGALDGAASITYAENGTGAVGTYTVSGVNAASAMWTLEGADSGHFSIGSSGASSMLTFSSPPNYEMPRGRPTSDTNTNTYVVTVKAEVGGETDFQDVTVTVTDVSELGSLDGAVSMTYAENGTDAVGNYYVLGGGSAAWTLEGDDGGAFSIGDTGETRGLTFASAPDFETPTDADTNNVYMVTIRVDGGGEMTSLDIEVTVTNAEEDGTIALSSQLPVVGNPLSAVLDDPDGGITNVTWIWETSSDEMATWGPATGPIATVATVSGYTPVDGDVGNYLRATANYNDDYDTGNSVVSRSAKVVATAVNVAPSFPTATTTRSIAENTAAGTNIGAPVVATDANADTLAYTLEGTDAASFAIDSGTGQLSTSAALNYEAKNTYTVVVTATDQGGLSDTITVTINVTDVGRGGLRDSG